MEAERWIQKGPVEPMTPRDKSLGELLLQRLREHGTKVLQIDGPTGERVSGAQLLARSVSVALELRARGVGPGDVVSAALDNCLEVAYVLLGALYVGAVYAPFNPDLAEEDTNRVVQLLAPRVVLCAPRAEAKMRAALPPGGEVVGVRRGSPDWASFLQHPPAAAADFLPATGLDLDAPAFIMSSSGTTGAPKGVMLSHRSFHAFMFMGDLFESFLSDEKRAKELGVMVLPNFWISGLMANILNFNGGTPLVIFPKFDVDVVLGGVQEYKITTLSLSPPQIVAIAKHPNVEQYDTSTLRMVSFGGAALSQPLREIAEKRLQKKITQFYGQTESLITLLPGPKSAEKPRSCGVPAWNSEAKIIDYENRKALGPNLEGEICLKNPLLFTGYYKDPEATAEVLDKDGWLHTGDVGYFDEDGYFYVCDRYKELVKYKGIHIAPAEVEGLLAAHESVRDAAVVGIEHDEDQEHPVGFVSLQEGRDVPKEELLQLLRDQLPEYKQLHGGIHYVEEIPRTATGKIQRRLLRQLARSLKEQQTEDSEPHEGPKDCYTIPLVEKVESGKKTISHLPVDIKTTILT